MNEYLFICLFVSFILILDKVQDTFEFDGIICFGKFRAVYVILFYPLM